MSADSALLLSFVNDDIEKRQKFDLPHKLNAFADNSFIHYNSNGGIMPKSVVTKCDILVSFSCGLYVIFYLIITNVL